MDIFEQMHLWLKQQTKIMALIPLTLAFVFIVGAIRNWDWLLAPSGSWKGLPGISAYFGRTTARVVSIICGLILFCVAYGMAQYDTW